jgi:hypothetical protein
MIEFLGDVNNDGRITLVDAILALQIASGMYVDADAENRADIDRSGSVSMSDVNAIINHLKGTEVIISNI